MFCILRLYILHVFIGNWSWSKISGNTMQLYIKVTQLYSLHHVYQIVPEAKKIKDIQFADRIRKCLWSHSENYSKWQKKWACHGLCSAGSCKSLAGDHGMSSLPGNELIWIIYTERKNNMLEFEAPPPHTHNLDIKLFQYHLLKNFSFLSLFDWCFCWKLIFHLKVSIILDFSFCFTVHLSILIQSPTVLIAVAL